jgi:hypothetical protein
LVGFYGIGGALCEESESHGVVGLDGSRVHTRFMGITSLFCSMPVGYKSRDMADGFTHAIQISYLGASSFPTTLARENEIRVLLRKSPRALTFPLRRHGGLGQDYGH